MHFTYKLHNFSEKKGKKQFFSCIFTIERIKKMYNFCSYKLTRTQNAPVNKKLNQHNGNEKTITHRVYFLLSLRLCFKTKFECLKNCPFVHGKTKEKHKYIQNGGAEAICQLSHTQTHTPTHFMHKLCEKGGW